MVPKSDWEWFGIAGHFICGRWCRFHLTTVVGEYLVSTVGEYVHPRHSLSEQKDAEWLEVNWPGEDIGLNRKYETMVFKAGKRCTSPNCGCGLPEIDGSELAMEGYNRPDKAAEGHLRLCEEFSTKV